MYQKLVDEGHDGRRMSFSPSEDGSIPGGHKAPKNKAHWYVGCFGITEPCSSECEISFSSCMSSKDQTTAAKKVTAFSECILDSADLTGCSADCSPTYDMLIQRAFLAPEQKKALSNLQAVYARLKSKFKNRKE